MKKTNLTISAEQIIYDVDYNSITDKQDSDISKLDDRYKITASDINILKKGGIELQEKLNEAIINAVGLVTFATGEQVSLISLVSTDSSSFELYTTDFIDPYLLQIEDHETRITDNTNDINTLESIVSNTFNTFGVYETSAGTLTEGTPIRPDLIENKQLDPNYISVQLSPNQFTNNANGTAYFTFNFSDVTNDVNDKTVGIRVFVNGVEPAGISPITQEVLGGTSGHQLIQGDVPFTEGDVIYFEYDIIEGTGSITANVAPKINIEVRGNSVTALSSDLIIDTSLTDPESGINPWKTLIDTNKVNITSNTESIDNSRLDIDNNTAQIDRMNTKVTLYTNTSSVSSGAISFTESFKNFEFLELRITHSNDRLAPVLNTQYINIADTLILATGDGWTIRATINSELEWTINGSSGNGVMSVTGKERIN